MITNHAFLDNPTFRGFRWNLLAHFKSIRVLDLHGNSKKNEAVPEGYANENVFDIQQGVAVSVLIRSQAAQKLANVLFAENWGSREGKHMALYSGQFNYQPVECHGPWFKISSQDMGESAEFGGFRSLAEVMPVNSTGIKTHRDAFVIDFDKEPLRERIVKFRGSESDTSIADEYGLTDTYGWKLGEARRRIRLRADWEKAFQLCLYRPFDFRHIYYHSDLVELPRHECMRHLRGGRNLAFLATRQITSPPFGHVLVTRLVSEMKTCSHDRGTNCFPLYLQGQGDDLAFGNEQRTNIQPSFLRELSFTMYGYNSINSDFAVIPTAESIFHYAYAVFHSPGYRERYAECLKTEFPRLPLPGGPDLYRDLAGLGGELVSLHLLESAALDRFITTLCGAAVPFVEKVSYARDTVWLDKAQTKGFRGVPEEVWNFHIGGYQVCEKWLKDRKGRTLSDDDVRHYQRIVVALQETIRLMGEIDQVIDAHGGWPGAFVIDTKGAAEAPSVPAPHEAKRPFRLISLDDERAKREAFKTLVPVYDLAAAAGAFGTGQAVESLGWMEPATAKPITAGMFVAQVKGTSMEPEIPNGAWALFGPPRDDGDRRIVLVQLRSASDPETGGAYTVKRLRRTVETDALGLAHTTRIVLEPTNVFAQAIVVEASPDRDVRVVAEFVEVVKETADA